MNAPVSLDILLTGGSGQVGTEVIRLAPAGVNIIAPGRNVLDMSDADAVASIVASRPWAAVINSAAHTAVDRAENEILSAWKINALAPAALAQATARAGIPLIQVSTDYVFDGSKNGDYLETDPVAPVSVYGASKEAGEQAVRTGNPRHVILRTAWVVSPHGTNFIKTMLRLAETRPELRVVDDQHGCPTSATDIALALLAITQRMIADPDAPSGTYHFVNSGEATWCGFARTIFEMAAAHGRATPKVEGITTADYPTPARRPANSRLNVEKLAQDYAISPRPWQEAVDEIVNALLTPQKE